MPTTISIGQYLPMDSPIHRLDARFKLFLTLFYIVTIFFAKGIYSYGAMIVFLAVTVAASKIKPAIILKSIKPLILIVILTAVLNMLYTAGDILWQWWIIKITREGVVLAVKMGLRILLLVTGSSILTFTTSPIMLTDAIEALLSPLKVFHVPVGELAMMMSIALRFIPTLMEETQKIMNAQKSRGADFETGSLTSRAKALVPILVPLFVSAFRRADELAMAMESRSYSGSEGRTRLKPLKASHSDYAFTTGSVVFLISVVILGCMGL